MVDLSSDEGRHSNGQSPKLKKHNPRYAGASSESSSEESDSDDDSSSDSNIEEFIVEDGEEDEYAQTLLHEQREKAQAKKQGIFFHVKPFIQWLVYVAVNPEGELHSELRCCCTMLT